MVRRFPTVLHTSDWQCGRPFLPRAAEALVRLAEQVGPEVIVVAGDLTQRAKVREYRMALDLIGRLPAVPVVTTPGNHDVPLYRGWERLLAPFKNWRRFISEELDTVTRVDGATIVSLSSAAPHHAVINGRLVDAQLGFAERAFAAASEADLRCLVVHHHFVAVPGGDGGHPLPRASRWLARIEDAGVDVVLGGHVHQLHITSSRNVLSDRAGPGVPLVACGTTTSRRGRGGEAGWNSLNVIRFVEGLVEVTPHRLGPDARDFEPIAARRLPMPRFVSRGAASGEAVP